MGSIHSFTLSFTHALVSYFYSFYKCFLCAFYVSGTVLSAGKTMVRKTESLHSGFSVLMRGEKDNKLTK